MRRFEAREALLEAAEGKLTASEHRRLRRQLVFRPFMARQAVDMVQANCIAMGMVTEDGEVAEAVDWETIIQLIMDLLPLILKLFGL